MKHKGGRPSAYKPEFTIIAKKLCALGATDHDLAEAFGVSDATVDNWKVAHPEFLGSLKAAKEIADAAVERSLYERATGYSHPDVHISSYEGEITITDITKHYPPDATSMIFWLKNRQKDKWRDKSEHEHGLSATLEEILKLSRSPELDAIPAVGNNGNGQKHSRIKV